MKFIALIVISVLGLDPASAMEFNKTVRSGVTVSMHHYRSWGADCKTNGGVVKLVTRPQHGKLVTRTIDSRIEINRFARGGATPCTGTPIKAFEVSYTSARGYHGADSFVIEMVNGNGSRDVDHYTVDVQ